MDIKLDQVRGIGSKVIYHLRNQSIWSPYDLILNVPKSYEDFSFTSLSQVANKQIVTIQGEIISEVKLNRFTKGEMVNFKLKVLNETIDIVVFHKSYLAKSLVMHDDVVVKGTFQLFKKSIVASSVIKPEKQVEIKPIYHIEGLFDKTISNLVQNIYEDEQVKIYENIPEEFLKRYQLVSRHDAYYNLHFPKSFEEIKQAQRRLKYEEAFFLQLKVAAKNHTYSKRKPKAYDINLVKAFIQTLPYELTKDQKDAVNDIFRDFKKEEASLRLIQGDVGSGKTVVSLIAIYAAITAKEQVSFMAPTEMLANQHYQYFKSALPDIRIALLTGKTKQKDQMKAQIKNHDYDLVIGTHALIEDDVIFDHLGLVVIDEQHKFGVSTRDELIEKAHHKDVIYLTATPIPRTLAMIIFGDSHVSMIKEKPKDRKIVETIYMTKDKIKDLYDAIDLAARKKEHIFVVVPAITSTKVSDNIETVYQELKERFNHPVFVLHGKLSSDEQTNMMESFMYTPGSILLSTTMIEVGIDIPTATIIAIFSAEYFGLSQLHQLRGRVGRSHLKSTCFLVSEKEDIDRLNLLSTEHDGFKLSEYDLRLRGPGNFLGEEQSGFLKFKFLNILEDYNVLIEAQKNINELISKPDFMTNPKYKYLNRYLKDEKPMI